MSDLRFVITGSGSFRRADIVCWALDKIHEHVRGLGHSLVLVPVGAGHSCAVAQGWAIAKNVEVDSELKHLSAGDVVAGGAKFTARNSINGYIVFPNNVLSVRREEYDISMDLDAPTYSVRTHGEDGFSLYLTADMSAKRLAAISGEYRSKTPASAGDLTAFMALAVEHFARTERALAKP